MKAGYSGRLRALSTEDPAPIYHSHANPSVQRQPIPAASEQQPKQSGQPLSAQRSALPVQTQQPAASSVQTIHRAPAVMSAHQQPAAQQAALLNDASGQHALAQQGPAGAYAIPQQQAGSAAGNRHDEAGRTVLPQYVSPKQEMFEEVCCAQQPPGAMQSVSSMSGGGNAAGHQHDLHQARHYSVYDSSAGQHQQVPCRQGHIAQGPPATGPTAAMHGSGTNSTKDVKAEASVSSTKQAGSDKENAAGQSHPHRVS